MKRLVFGAVTIALLLVAVPASAQTAPRAAVTAPGDAALVAGVVGVNATGSAAAGIKSLQLFVHDIQVASREPSDLRQNAEVGYSWNTNHIPGSSQIAPNGWYQIRVRVVANDGAEATATRNVRVDNGAATPSGMSVRTSQQTVTLTWNPNPEPDIVGYRLEVDRGGGFTTLATTKSTDYSYTPSPGTYSWRVLALRNSPSESGGKASAPSDSVAASIAAPPGGTSDDGGGAASGGRNSVKGDKNIFGGSNKKARSFVRKTQRRFASLGISRAGMSLPGIALGLPRLPDGELKWGTYKGKLPYNTPEQQPGSVTAEPVRLAARTTSTVMPLDALQWLAAGILMVVIAALLQFLARQTGSEHTPT